MTDRSRRRLDIPAHREVLETAGWDTEFLLPVEAEPRSVAVAIAKAVDTHGPREPKVVTWDDVADGRFALYQRITLSNGR